MKTRHQLPLTLLGVVIPLTSSAVISLGDSLLIDFSQTGATYTTDTDDDPNGAWNNVTGPALGFGASADPIPTASNLVRYADGMATDVSFSLIIPATSQVGISSSVIPVAPNAAFTATGAIPTSAQSDVVIGAKILDGHPATPVTFQFNNLDDGLLYNLEFQAWDGSYERDPKDYVIQLGLPSESTISVDPNDLPSVYAFNNIATDGAGHITLTMIDLEKGADTSVINAMALTAIPEPGFYASVCGLTTLALILLRRQSFRRRN